MTNRFPNGHYKHPSNDQDEISQSVFKSFHECGTRVTMGTDFDNPTGECTYTYYLGDAVLLVLRLTYRGEFITQEN